MNEILELSIFIEPHLLLVHTLIPLINASTPIASSALLSVGVPMKSMLQGYHHE